MLIPSFKAGIITFIRKVVAAVPNEKLYTWGLGTFGRLGLGDTATRSSPTQVGTGTDWESSQGTLLSNFGIKSDGSLWAWGRNANGQLGTSNTTDRSSPVQVGSLTDWSKVFGSRHTIAVKTNGTI